MGTGEMSKIKENIEKMAGDGSQIDPTEFENLILDDVNIEKFSAEDKTYMEEFVAVDMLGMNATKLEGYTQKVFELLPGLAILDGKNKEGEEIISQESDEDEEEYGGEEGEEDDEDFDQQEYIDKISK